MLGGAGRRRRRMRRMGQCEPPFDAWPSCIAVALFHSTAAGCGSMAAASCGTCVHARMRGGAPDACTCHPRRGHHVCCHGCNSSFSKLIGRRATHHLSGSRLLAAPPGLARSRVGGGWTHLCPCKQCRAAAQCSGCVHSAGGAGAMPGNGGLAQPPGIWGQQGRTTAVRGTGRVARHPNSRPTAAPAAPQAAPQGAWWRAEPN